jgi:hypothetical protein
MSEFQAALHEIRTRLCEILGIESCSTTTVGIIEAIAKLKIERDELRLTVRQLGQAAEMQFTPREMDPRDERFRDAWNDMNHRLRLALGIQHSQMTGDHLVKEVARIFRELETINSFLDSLRHEANAADNAKLMERVKTAKKLVRDMEPYVNMSFGEVVGEIRKLKDDLEEANEAIDENINAREMIRNIEEILGHEYSV